MPATTHVKFFEYKPSGRDKRLQKTQTGSHSTLPIHLVRKVNQVATQNRSSQQLINTSNSSSVLSSSGGSSTNATSTIPLKRVIGSTSTTTHNDNNQTIPLHVLPREPYNTHAAPLYKHSPPHPHSQSTCIIQPTQYYSHTYPPHSHPNYLNAIARPLPPQLISPQTTLLPPHTTQQQYLIQPLPQYYRHALSGTESSNSYHPINQNCSISSTRSFGGVSKQHKLLQHLPIHRQRRASHPLLCEKSLAMPKYQNRTNLGSPTFGLPLPRLSISTITTNSTTSPLPNLINSKSVVVSGLSSTEISGKDEPITTSPSSSCELACKLSPHLNVGTLPSIAELIGPTRSKTFRSAISLTDILN